MTATLLTIIGLLLIFIGWQQYQHERWVESLTPAPPLRFLPAPPVPSPATWYARSMARERALERRLTWPPVEPAPLPTSHMPFLLERAPDRLTPTRRMHPRFESYGVDVSVCPTIGID